MIDENQELPSSKHAMIMINEKRPVSKKNAIIAYRKGQKT